MRKAIPTSNTFSLEIHKTCETDSRTPLQANVDSLRKKAHKYPQNLGNQGHLYQRVNGFLLHYNSVIITNQARNFVEENFTVATLLMSARHIRKRT